LSLSQEDVVKGLRSNCRGPDDRYITQHRQCSEGSRQSVARYNMQAVLGARYLTLSEAVI